MGSYILGPWDENLPEVFIFIPSSPDFFWSRGIGYDNAWGIEEVKDVGLVSRYLSFVVHLPILHYLVEVYEELTGSDIALFLPFSDVICVAPSKHKQASRGGLAVERRERWLFHYTRQRKCLECTCAMPVVSILER